MKDQSTIRYLLSICLLYGVYMLAGCSYLTNFVVINATDRPIEIQYVIKQPGDSSPLFSVTQTLPITPAIKSVLQLGQQTEWRELSAAQYTFDPDNRRVGVSLMPNEALRIDKQNL